MALFAGISLIFMAIAAGFSYGYILTTLVAEDDPFTTFQQLQTQQSLFLAGLGGWLVIFVTDLIVTWSMYVFFKNVNKNLSLITALLRMGYTLILGIALTKLFFILSLIQSPLGGQIEFAGSQVLSYLESFERIWSMGLVVFGVHLLGLGYLSLLYRPVPRIFAYLLLLAGLSYVLVHSGRSLLGLEESLVNTMERLLSIPMALGEILFAFWLIIRGGKEINKQELKN